VTDLSSADQDYPRFDQRMAYAADQEISIMTYNSTFQDRAGQSAQAKQKALEQFRSRPPVDEKLAAERKAAAQQREEAKAEKAATKKAEAEAKAADDAAKAAASAPPTEAEAKAARDARYAARKRRR
jgi:hypothetical protein